MIGALSSCGHNYYNLKLVTSEVKLNSKLFVMGIVHVGSRSDWWKICLIYGPTRKYRRSKNAFARHVSLGDPYKGRQRFVDAIIPI